VGSEMCISDSKERGYRESESAASAGQKDPDPTEGRQFSKEASRPSGSLTLCRAGTAKAGFDARAFTSKRRGQYGQRCTEAHERRLRGSTRPRPEGGETLEGGEG
jgi:hypothetical protein